MCFEPFVVRSGSGWRPAAGPAGAGGKRPREKRGKEAFGEGARGGYKGPQGPLWIYCRKEPPLSELVPEGPFRGGSSVGIPGRDSRARPGAAGAGRGERGP